jgi:hypothetical protein
MNTPDETPSRKMLSLALPYEIGHQLSAFAKTNGMTMGDAVAALLDCGAKNGLDCPRSLPGVQIQANAGGFVEISFGAFSMSPLTVAQARSFAGELRVTWLLASYRQL